MVELSGDVTSLVVAGDRVVASVVEVVALTTDGAEAWRADLDTGAGASLNTVQGSTVVAVGPSGAVVVAVDAASGQVMADDDFHVDEDLWQGSGFRMPGGDIMMYGNDGSVDLIDGTSGRRLGGVGDEFTAISRSMLFVQDDDEVTAFGLDDLEEERWSIKVDGSARILPGPGLVLVQDDDGYRLWS